MAHSPEKGFDYHDKMIIAHALFASITTLITVPAAILVARFFRSRSWWFRAHVILHTLTIAFTVLFFILSTVAVASGGNGSQFVGPKKDPHHDLGLSVVILLLVEASFGVAAHWTSTKQSATGGAFPTLKAKKNPLRHVHTWYGVFVAALLYSAMKTGIDEWNMVADSKTLVPYGIQIAFWVIFSVEVAAYVVGWFLEAFPSEGTSNPGEEPEEKGDTPSL